MAENEVKRARRTPQERAEAIDVQIGKMETLISGYEAKAKAFKDECDKKIDEARGKIKQLEEKKAAILAPKPPRKPRMTKKQKIEAILKKAQKSGKSAEEIAEALGIDIDIEE